MAPLRRPLHRLLQGTEDSDGEEEEIEEGKEGKEDEDRRERKRRDRLKVTTPALRLSTLFPRKDFFLIVSGGSALTTDSSREESAEGVERKAAPGVRQARD